MIPMRHIQKRNMGVCVIIFKSRPAAFPHVNITKQPEDFKWEVSVLKSWSYDQARRKCSRSYAFLMKNISGWM